MKPTPVADRRALFARLDRMRAIERQAALEQLAARRAEQARMEEVARRSRALVGTGLGAGGSAAQDGAGLAAALVFHARLAGLVSEADRMGAQAGAAEAQAQATFAAADRGLARLRERRAELDREAEAQRLARSLLSESHKPRGQP